MNAQEYSEAFDQGYNAGYKSGLDDIRVLRAQVLDAEIRFGNFKEDLKSLVHKLREAIDDERGKANAEIERLSVLLDDYRAELEQADKEIMRLTRQLPHELL